MRLQKRRPPLPATTRKKLAAHKASLLTNPDPAKVCEQRFNGAREAKWFDEVREALKNMAGPSRTCMFCDHNEPTDVEHFKPKTEFPRLTFSWGNMLWICTACNRHKGTRFPPHNCAGAPLLNPDIHNVWDHFFINIDGLLTKRWDIALDAYDPTAQSTCDYVAIDREEVQTRRQKRLKSLRLSVNQAIAEIQAGNLSLPEATARISDWLAEPFQADIADYFFRGPGQTEHPFADLLALGPQVPPL